MESIQFTITAAEGLHARPATMLVSASSAFTSDLQLVYGEKKGNLKSILAIMSLGVPTGSDVSIEISGDDATLAKNQLTQIITDLSLGEIK